MNVGVLDSVQVLDGRVRRTIVIVVGIMPKPEIGAVLIRLFNSWLAKSMSYSHQAVDIDKLDIVLNAHVHSFLNRTFNVKVIKLKSWRNSVVIIGCGLPSGVGLASLANVTLSQPGSLSLKNWA